MRHYFRWTFGIVCTGGVIFLCTAAVLFYRSMERRTELEQRRMLAAAVQCDLSINDMLNELSADGADDDVNEWLDQFSAAGGFEQIIICDTAARVVWSAGGDLFSRGETITDLIIDTARFSAATASDSALFTGPVSIDGVYFNYLYYGALINGEPQVIIIEEDPRLLEQSAGFKTLVIAVFSGIAVLFSLLLGLLVFIDGKARRAQAAAAHNDRLAFLGTASAQLAHELKNPLAIIKSSVDVLGMKYDPSKKDPVLGFISAEIMRIAAVIDNMLAFSRKAPLRREVFSPSQELEIFCATYMSGRDGLEIRNQLDPHYTITADKTAFVQIAANLIRNAVAAMNDRGVILVRATAEQGTLVISFTDSGPGIAPEIRKKLFTPFVSGSKTGAGLGLAIVRSLCEAQGWRAALKESRAGETTFTITIAEGQWQKQC